MPMKIIKVIGVTIFFAAVTAFAANSENTIWQTVSTIGAGVVSATITSLYEFIATKGHGLKTWFQAKILYRNKDVYLSFSYLYRIQIDGDYLMIRGHRMKDRFQPIGGVYKYYREAKPELERMKCRPSVVMGNTDETDDIRLSIPGNHVLAFVEWFRKMENREYDPLREFNEELLESRLLPLDKFQKLQYRKVFTHDVGFTFFEGSNGTRKERPEYIYADIFEVILSDDQKRIIKDAIQKQPEALCLVSAEEIRNLRCNGSIERNLGTNAPWVIGEE